MKHIRAIILGGFLGAVIGNVFNLPWYVTAPISGILTWVILGL